jgi:hypothetical protein
MDWNLFYQSLALPNLGPNVEFAVPKPSDAWLDEYETTMSFRLPQAYREYIKVFGPGELGGHFQILGPQYRLVGRGKDTETFNQRSDLDAYTEYRRKNAYGKEVAKGIYSDPARINRLIFFAFDTCLGDDVGWDPEEVRDAASNEYGIYVVERDEHECARPFADSFTEFITERVLKCISGEEVERRFVPATFRPYSRHKPSGTWLSRVE